MSKIVRSIKNVANGYLSTQILVRKATSNDASGPTTYDMEEISAATHNSQGEFLEIMDMLDRRLNDKGKNWRHVAKSLTVLEYLVRFGSDKCVLWAKDNLYIVTTLTEFVHFDEANVDQGKLIRVKAKELVALLKNSERLARERQQARSGAANSRRERPQQRNSDPYDADLQRALEMSMATALDEQHRRTTDDDDSDLQAALKLSLEEEELRKLRQNQPQGRLQTYNNEENLLDLDGPAQPLLLQQQYYQQMQFAQPTQFFQPQQTYYQVDMFGNPIQQTAGFYYQNPVYGQYGQPQPQTQNLQPQVPQYTGFAPAQTQQPQELKPLKTGSNNPFALPSDSSRQSALQDPSLNTLANSQPAFYTQPTVQQQPQQQQQAQRPQSQQTSRFDDKHELNNLLASGTGLDTFGNTGASRIPHQHTRNGTFINSSGTGYNDVQPELRVSSNATGNPFLNTGMGNGSTSQNRIVAAPTGFGFGNSKEDPSLIDI